MSDEQNINEESLSRVEDLLMKVDLRADDSEQTKILLACGRAEGRAELRRTLRRWQAGAAALSTLSVCLLAALVLRPPAVSSDSSPHMAEIVIEQDRDAPRVIETIRPRATLDEKLHVSTNWTAWIEKSQSLPDQPEVVTPPILPQKPTLMASSRIDLKEFME